MRKFLSIPAGETVKLIADLGHENKMVDVLWEGHTVTVSAIDLKLWGIETRAES